MGIKTIPLSRLEQDLEATLHERADSGQAVVVDLPDGRLIAIQALEPSDDDSLIDDLLESNPTFQRMVTRSKTGPRKPFRTDSA